MAVGSAFPRRDQFVRRSSKAEVPSRTELPSPLPLLDYSQKESLQKHLEYNSPIPWLDRKPLNPEKKNSSSFWQNDWWTGTRSRSVISPAFPWDPGLRRFRTASVWSNSCDGRILPPVLEFALWWMLSAPSLACCSHPICNSHLGTLKRKDKNGRKHGHKEQHQRHVPQQNGLWNTISSFQCNRSN